MIEIGDFCLIIIILALLITCGVTIGFIVGLLSGDRPKH